MYFTGKIISSIDVISTVHIIIIWFLIIQLIYPHLSITVYLNLHLIASSQWGFGSSVDDLTHNLVFWQIFDDADKSDLSCIIVDDIERLLGMPCLPSLNWKDTLLTETKFMFSFCDVNAFNSAQQHCSCTETICGLHGTFECWIITWGSYWIYEFRKKLKVLQKSDLEEI